MAVLKMPQFLRRPDRPQFEPDKSYLPDPEVEAIGAIGQWLSTLSTDEARLRALTFHMWKLKDGTSPKQTDWVESIAEQSTMMVSKKHGFSEGVE